MKIIIKKIIEMLYGPQKNITFKLSLSFLSTSIILFLFAFLYEDNSALSSIFLYASSCFFAFWLMITKGSESAINFSFELVRLGIFFLLLILSLTIFINIKKYHGIILFGFMVLSCISLFMCTFYLVSKLNDIFDFMKSIFIKFKSKLYNSTNTSTSKTKSLIENITAYLTAIGALFIAVKAITETIISILNSINSNLNI